MAVLPFGATEPHNLHLPYGTDIFEGDIVGERICESAHSRGAKVVLLPTIPYGTETNLDGLSAGHERQPVDAVCPRHRSGGFPGKARRQEDRVAQSATAATISSRYCGNCTASRRAQLFLCNWYRVLADMEQQLFEHKDDHAGEMETSFALAFFPELVARHDDGTLIADDGAAKIRFEAVNRGWVSITRPWHLLTTNTGAGNPHEPRPKKAVA